MAKASTPEEDERTAQIAERVSDMIMPLLANEPTDMLLAACLSVADDLAERLAAELRVPIGEMRNRCSRVFLRMP